MRNEEKVFLVKLDRWGEVRDILGEYDESGSSMEKRLDDVVFWGEGEDAKQIARVIIEYSPMFLEAEKLRGIIHNITLKLAEEIAENLQKQPEN